MLRKLKHLVYSASSETYKKQYLINQERSKLSNFPRFQETQTMLDDKIIRIPDAASFLFIYDEMFKKEIYKFDCKKKNPLIIDCGANIGLSVLYFKKLFPSSKVIAFEPDPKIFEILDYNIKAFDLENVALYNTALWNEEKELDFNAEGADGGRLSDKDNAPDNLVKIKALKLSKFLDRTVDFLKIDIEGAEYEVLKECETALRNVDKLFVEYHSFCNQEQHLDEILLILKRSGFRYNIQHIGVFSKHPFVSINNYSGMDLQLNIFAYR